MKLLYVLLSFLLINCSHLSHNKKIMVIAHRSSSGYLPEHTLQGVSMSHAFNVDYIEPDVVLTKDNVLVVLHDPFLDTTTDVAKVFPRKKRADGRYHAIDFTLKEIKTLHVFERIEEEDIHSKTPKMAFPLRFPRAMSVFTVPTLEEVIQLVQGLNKSRNKNIGLYVETKAVQMHLDEGHDIIKEAFLLLQKYGYNNPGAPLYFQCFDPVALKRLKNEFHPNFPLIQLIAENSWNEAKADFLSMRTENGLKEISSYADGIGPWVPHVLKYEKNTWQSTGLSKLAHSFGLKVHPYTVRADSLPDNITNYNRLVDLLVNVGEVDGFFTDQPDLAVNFFKNP